MGCGWLEICIPKCVKNWWVRGNNIDDIKRVCYLHQKVIREIQENNWDIL